MTSPSWMVDGEGSMGTEMGAGATFSRSFSWDLASERCFSFSAGASAGLLVPEAWASGWVSGTSMSMAWVRSLGATQGTSLRTSFEIKEAFLGERCEPALDLFTSCEGARTGVLLSGTAFVEAGAFGLRENLRLALLEVVVEVAVVEEPVVVVFGWVMEVAAREILSFSFSAGRVLSRSSGETKVETVMDGFWVLSLSASVDEEGVRSCACAPGPTVGEMAASVGFSVSESSGGDWGVAMGCAGEKKRGGGYLWVWGRMGAGWEEEEKRRIFVRDFVFTRRHDNVQTMWDSAIKPGTYTLLLPTGLKIQIKQIIRRQLLVLVARKIRLNRQVPREPERFKLHVHQHPTVLHCSKLTRSIAACSSGVTFTTDTPGTPSPSPSGPSPPPPKIFASISGLFASNCPS